MIRYQNGGCKDTPFVSIVVIGRNEEKNLDACFRSISSMDYPHERYEVIYVDTCSNDRSVDVARRHNVRVAEEHSAFPTPGLARNRGIMEAKYGIIHFVDGDMTIDRTYLSKAVAILGKNNVVCVIGRVLERNNNSSFYAKVLNYPWRNRQAGYIDAPGAGGTFLKSILKGVGGYNPSILKGQETELGVRIKRNGYQIYMIENTMGIHDYGIDDLTGLFRHFYSIGKSLGKLLTLSDEQSYAGFRRKAKSLLIQGLIFIALVFLAIVTRRYLFFFAIPFAVALWVAIRYRREHHGCRDRYALGYYLLLHYAKPIVLSGMISFFWRHFVYDKVTRLTW